MPGFPAGSHGDEDGEDDLLQLTSFDQPVFFPPLFVSLTVFETGSQSVVPFVLGFTRRSFCLCPLSASVKDMCHHTWPLSYFLAGSGRVEGSPQSSSVFNSRKQLPPCLVSAPIYNFVLWASGWPWKEKREDSTP